MTMNGIGKDLTGNFPGLCEGNNPQSDCRKEELKVGKKSYTITLLYIYALSYCLTYQSKRCTGVLVYGTVHLKQISRLLYASLIIHF